eukprot:scaffold952_cov409-Prasinococcus_capsulatus_cf.AAC.31
MTILALLVQRPHGARLASELEKAEEGLRLSRVQDPTLRWTPEAQFIVDKAMRALQEPDGDCEGEGRKFLVSSTSAHSVHSRHLQWTTSTHTISLSL